jgi:hypothetical protein
MVRRYFRRELKQLLARREQVRRAIAEMAGHPTDHDLERYHLGMVVDDAELDRLEEHLLSCPVCGKRAEEAADYVDLIRVAIIQAGLDL